MVPIMLRLNFGRLVIGASDDIEEHFVRPWDGPLLAMGTVYMAVAPRCDIVWFKVSGYLVEANLTEAGLEEILFIELVIDTEGCGSEYLSKAAVLELFQRGLASVGWTASDG